MSTNSSAMQTLANLGLGKSPSWVDNPTGMQGIPQPVANPRTGALSLPALPTLPDTGNIALNPITEQLHQMFPSIFTSAGATGNHPNQTSGAVTSTVKKAVLPAASAVSSFVLSNRFVVLAIGLIMLAAGIFSLKTTGTVIDTVSGTAKNVAKIAA